MPAGRKPKDPRDGAHLEPKDAEEIRRHYRRSSVAFFRDVSQVEDRDSPGLILPWSETIRQAQHYKIRTWRQVRAFNLYRNIIGLELQDRAKHLLGKWRNHANFGSSDIMDYGITGLIEDIKGGFEQAGQRVPKLHDGPLRMVEGKGRQVGFSYAQQQKQLWRATTSGPIHFLTVAHDEDTSKRIFGYSRVTYENWPEKLLWMRPAAPYDGRGMYEFDNGSSCTVRTAGGVRIVGRKLDGIHSSEISHYESADAFAHALSAVPLHCHVHVESTANGPKGFFYETMMEALTIEDMMALYDQRQPVPTGWIYIFTPWLDDPEYKIAPEPWEIPQLRDTLDPYELNLQKTDKRFDWSRIKFRRYKLQHDLRRHEALTPAQFWSQEYPATRNEMFQSSGDSLFDQSKLAKLFVYASDNPIRWMFFADGQSEPHLVDEERLATLLVWNRPETRQQYVIGADIAGGLKKDAKRDRSWITVWRRIDDYNIEQVAEWRGRIGPRYLAEIIVLLALWYNDAYCVIEANSMGQGVIDAVTIDLGYSNLYIHKPRGILSAGSDQSVRYGFITTQTSRQQLIRDFAGAIDAEAVGIKSKLLLEEAQNFGVNEDGKAEALSGHDDGVFSAAFGTIGSMPGRGAPGLDRERRTQGDEEVGGGGEALESAGRDTEIKVRLSAEDRGVWDAIVEDLKWHSLEAGYDPDTGRVLDPQERQRLLKQAEWESRR